MRLEKKARTQKFQDMGALRDGRDDVRREILTRA